MDKLKDSQVLLLKWLKHFNVRSIEQIRITSKSLCISNNIDEKNSVLKLLYPLLKMGFVEFIGEGRYQVSPSIIISYPQKSLAVGVNLTAPQKDKLNDISYQEDEFGNIRFSTKDNDVEAMCRNLNCHYQKFYTITPLVHFPKIKDVVTNFDECYSIFEKIQFYDTYKHKWEYGEKSIGIFRVSSDSFVYYLKIREKTYKIRLSSDNPEEWILAECYQASCNRDDLFSYNKTAKILTVNNLNLPILVERILRLSSLYQKEAIISKQNFQVCYPDTSIATIKELNRIFDTKTIITNG